MLAGPEADSHDAFKGFPGLRPRVGRMVHPKGAEMLHTAAASGTETKQTPQRSLPQPSL